MKPKLAVFLVLLVALGGSAFAQNNARMLSAPNAQAGTAYTFVAADTTRVVTFSNASPVAVTLPNGATFGFGAGTMLSVMNLGAGQVTITCSSCTINGAATLALSQNSGADIYGGTGASAINYVALPSPTGANFAALGGNNAFTGNSSHSGTEAFTGPTSVTQGSGTFTGDTFFKSGRPWYDVMAFGAKNDNSTDDTAAIQLAITTACSASPVGGIIYFPRGPGYKTANTSTPPFVISCNNLTFKGVAWEQANLPFAPSLISGPNLTSAMFSITGNVSGFSIEDLGLSGNGASAGAVAISGSGSAQSGRVQRVFFDNWGGAAILTTTSVPGWWVIDNWAQNCLLQRPAAVDGACFDLGNNDIMLQRNFVTTSVPTAAGNIGTGHTYSYALRGTNGFATNNMGEISQHGWLISGNYITFIGNRAFLNQGNGFHITGVSDIFIGNKAINSSQSTTNTSDGFLCDGFCSTNIFSGNLVDDNASGNGNHTRHGFTDNNSNGASDGTGNKYADNRLGNGGVLGVLYNMIGASPYAIQHPHKIASVGDASVTVQCGIDAETQFFNTALTATRTVTLSSTGAWNGCRFRVVRSDQTTGAFNLNVTTSTGTITLSLAGQSADFEFINSQWRPAEYTPLLCVTSQKSESAADTNVLTCTPPALAGSYRIRLILSVSAANAATLGWTATWTDSNGAAQAPTNLALFQSGTAAPALTFTTSVAGNYYADAQIDVNNAAASIVIKLTFTGTSFTGKATATVERLI